jgi:hypothetical protein
MVRSTASRIMWQPATRVFSSSVQYIGVRVPLRPASTWSRQISSLEPIFFAGRSIPSSKREIGPIGTEPGVFAPMSISWVTPAAQPSSSPSQKMGTMVCTSALWTSPIIASLLAKMSPGAIPGLSS